MREQWSMEKSRHTLAEDVESGNRYIEPIRRWVREHGIHEHIGWTRDQIYVLCRNSGDSKVMEATRALCRLAPTPNLDIQEADSHMPLTRWEDCVLGHLTIELEDSQERTQESNREGRAERQELAEAEVLTDHADGDDSSIDHENQAPT